MVAQTTIVLLGDNGHIVKVDTHGFCMGDRIAMLHMRGDGKCIMEAATSDLEKKNCASVVALQGH